MPVPLFDNAATLGPLKPRILEAIAEVVADGRFILGPQLEAFERELAAHVGVAHAVGVGNGTDALTIAARALGVRAGDEVVVPAFTFFATAEAIASLGAVPVFCDVDPDTRNVTPETVAAALTPRTAAVVAVDLFGVPAPCGAIRDRTGLPVIEDAAQALGSSIEGVRCGALGDVATFSFYPSKNLGALGDGGAIVCDDEGIAERARALRFHGSRDKRTFEQVGYNSRLDELQAAVLRVLLPELAGWCAGRRRAFEHYARAGIAEHVQPPACPPGAEPAWHLYVASARDSSDLGGSDARADPERAASTATALLSALNAAGIQARPYYRTPLHRQPAMAPFVTPGLRLPVTERLAATNLALPMSPSLSAEQAGEVVAALAGAAIPS
jgi:dTDP-4-amino-4,6-dideoxygalactose transaminase